ncbi:cytochrome P450 71D95-like isoform X2 [Andrographis paniculata]|uniref:cytochrome P450 71D95-like isoform X2 n=1 Tax=Andrographis paniculata TaxID=175694 RepID=UPI0021E94A49|nr:cytochrome P450 71D95-like isoform X2 [Andrographis paniculata]
MATEPITLNYPTLLILSPLIIFFLIRIFNPWRRRRNPQNLPPSPPKLPVIGHLHHLLGGLPHQVLARLSRKYGRVLLLHLGEISTVVISSPAAAKQVLKDQDPACADRPKTIGLEIMWYNYSDLAFCPYNDQWRQLRKICVLELLSSKNVKSFGYIREDEASHLISTVQSFAASREAINLTETILRFSSSVICRAALGKDQTANGDALIEMMKKALSMAGGFELADLFPSSKLLNLLCLNKYRLMWMHRKLDSILDDIVDEHKLRKGGEYGGEDIVDAMLRINRSEDGQDSISKDNIKAIIFDMFSGGTETTSTTIDWAMAELMKNPRVMAKAQAELREILKEKKTINSGDIEEMKYLKLVIKETLRLHPPMPLLPRACRDKCMVNGYSIPLKSKILVNVWAIGRDHEYWDEAEMFKPERFEDSSRDFFGNNFDYLPFGTGKRICPGINFGLANVELPLARLLYHFDWRMPDGMEENEIDMTEGSGITVSRKNDLFLVPLLANAP